MVKPTKLGTIILENPMLYLLAKAVVKWSVLSGALYNVILTRSMPQRRLYTLTSFKLNHYVASMANQAHNQWS